MLEEKGERDEAMGIPALGGKVSASQRHRIPSLSDAEQGDAEGYGHSIQDSG